MRKSKVTVKSLREDLKNLQAQFDAYMAKARAYALENSRLSNRRALMTIEPTTDKGLVNGITIAELVMLVNLNDAQGETTLLETTNNKKNLSVIARKRLAITPIELL
jgi:hypothetical protein